MLPFLFINDNLYKTYVNITHVQILLLILYM